MNAVGKGWNEFVLYGDNTDNLFDVFPDYYYMYVGMTWDNGNGRILTEQGAGRGLFFRNFVNKSVEGFHCYRDNLSYFNWLCESVYMSDFFFDPTVPRMPVNRSQTSYWTCGVEDQVTYTQA